MIDKRPALIVRCGVVSDVISALELAREADALVSVRGGGHGVAGNALCDDGVVIDLSARKRVWVDPDNRTARAEGGTTWGDFDNETQSLERLTIAEQLRLDVLELDVTNEASVQDAVRRALEQAGRLDVVINNAGFAGIGVTEAYTPEQFQQVFNVNLYGVVRVNRAYVSHPNELDQPYACPLRCTDLTRLPEAFIILPEADPLRDEGLRYAERLRQAGVPMQAKVYPGMVHGFWLLGGVIPQALTPIDDAARVLRSCLMSERSAEHTAEPNGGGAGIQGRALFTIGANGSQ